MGAISCFIGKFPLFVTFTLSALLHECAHAFTAGRYGYQLNEILLLPYGAVVKGDLTEAERREELFICLSGPFFSGAIALSTLALWWLFPDCYPYTEDIFYANKVLCLSNLLPVYPLDGGRILRLFLKKIAGERRGELFSRLLGGALAVVLSLFFAWRKDFAAAAFYASLPFGLIGGGRYQRMTFCHLDSFARGIREERVAISENATVRQALRFAGAEHYLLFDLYSSDGEFLGTCRQEAFERLFLEKGLDARLCEILTGNDKIKKEKDLICKEQSDILYTES